MSSWTSPARQSAALGKLKEYQQVLGQIDRLEELVGETADPDMRKYLLDQLASYTNIAEGQQDELGIRANVVGNMAQQRMAREAAESAGWIGVKTFVKDPKSQLAGGFVPGVGEALDISVLLNPDAAWWEKGIAAVSLGANVFTAGLLPNFGGAVRGTANAGVDTARGLADAADAPGDVVHQTDELAECLSEADNIYAGLDEVPLGDFLNGPDVAQAGKHAADVGK